MPRKPRTKQERLKSPMCTRSSANTPCSLSNAVTPKTGTTCTPKTRKMASRNAQPPFSSSKMPALAALIAAALNVDIGAPTDATKTLARVKVAPAVASPSLEAATASPLAAASPVAPTISPSCKENRPKRRKRETIKLPPTVSLATLSAEELRRLKNRISASRLRERSQQSMRQMEEQLEVYKQRCEFLESVVSGCSSCAVLSAVQFGEIELLPFTREEQQEGDLTEAECFVLGNVLQR
ncbi:hypothetical protein PRNP1_011641 [Phytophthora ramorum]